MIEATGVFQTAEEAKLLAEIQLQMGVQRKGGARWSREDQRTRSAIFQKMIDKGYTYEGETGDILAEIFPLTKEGSLAALRKDIHWATTKRGTQGEIEELMNLTKGEGASRHCIRLRAPGGEIVPLLTEKKGIKWETFLEDWLQEKHAIPPIEQIKLLGETIANAYGLQKYHVLNDVGVADQYIATYHFEALVPGHEHEAHCCGAHGNDTHRAMMSALVQASLIAWATDGKKQVMIKGRRTMTKEDGSRLITPPARFDRFLADHFSKGILPQDPEKKLIGEGALYEGEDRNKASMKALHSAIIAFNKATPKTKEEGMNIKKVLISCADDRVGVRINERGGIQVSDVPEHISNTMHVSIGERANKILNDQVEPPVVYRSTLVAGIPNISMDDMPFIHRQMVHDVPLIVKQVMSREDRTKYIFIDTVIGAEPPDFVDVKAPDRFIYDEHANWQELRDPSTGERKKCHPDTLKILKNQSTLEEAKIDPSLIKAIAKNQNEVLGLSESERKECIALHEVRVFKELRDKIILGDGGLIPALKAETEREYRDDQRRFGQPRNLIVYYRVMRAAKRTVEAGRLTIHSGA